MKTWMNLIVRCSEADYKALLASVQNTSSLLSPGSDVSGVSPLPVVKKAEHKRRHGNQGPCLLTNVAIAWNSFQELYLPSLVFLIVQGSNCFCGYGTLMFSATSIPPFSGCSFFTMRCTIVSDAPICYAFWGLRFQHNIAISFTRCLGPLANHSVG